MKSSFWGRWRTILASLGVLAICAGVFSIHYRLPGLFMDSINPEYLAANILGDVQGFRAWILPGNMAFGKYPILAGSYYHGPLQLYLSLPVYMALGLTIESARIAQCLYALAILWVASRLLARAKVSDVLIFIGLVLLAIDPGFVQVFKTQGLSNLWPLSLYLLALLLIDGAGKPKTNWRLLVGGVLLGLAFFSYFIYLFFAPVAYLYALDRLTRAEYRGWAAFRASCMLVLGFFIGAFPYCVGFYLLDTKLGSFSGFTAHLQSGAMNLGVIQTPVGGVAGALGELWTEVRGALTDVWLNDSVLGQVGRVHHPARVTAFFLGVPWIVGALLLIKQVQARWLHVINASIACYLLSSLPFAARFDGHHYVMILPLGYLAWILAIHYLQQWLAPSRQRWLVGASIVVALFSLAGSIHGQLIYLQALEKTGGVGAYSDALNRFSADVARDDVKVMYYLPDWGFMMPLQFLTAGKILVEPSEPDRDGITRLVCSGGSVAVVYGIEDPSSIESLAAHERRLAAFGGLVPGAKVDQKAYSSRDGRHEFTVATLTAKGLPEGWCGFDRLSRCTISTQSGVSVAVEPCDITRCPKPQGRQPEVRFAWDAGNTARDVEIWVGDESGEKLWVRSSSKGQEVTGPWASPGMRLELRDAGSGATLATAKLGGRDCRR